MASGPEQPGSGFGDPPPGPHGAGGPRGSGDPFAGRGGPAGPPAGSFGSGDPFAGARPGAAPPTGDPFGPGAQPGRYGPDPSFGPNPSYPDPSFGPDGGAPNTAVLDGTAIGGPPLTWLILGLVAGAAGAVAAFLLGASPAVAFASWAVAGPVAIGLLAVYAMQDTKQRARPVYTSPEWVSLLYWAVVVVAAVGILVSAWRIAEWAGRL